VIAHRPVVSALVALIVAQFLHAAPPSYTVDRGDIEATLHERGAVEAANIYDVAAPSGDKSRPLVIKWVIAEGSHVKKGERLVEFDNHFVREQLALHEAALIQAEAGLSMAERDAKIAQLSGNKEIRSAQSTLELIQAAVKQASESEAISRKRLDLRIKAAELGIEKAKLGQKAKSPESKIAIQTAELEREAVLLDVREFDLQSKAAKRQAELQVREARDNLDLAKLSSEQRRAGAEAGVLSARASLLRAQATYDSVKQEAGKSAFVAPADGTVVFADAGRTNGVAAGQQVAPGTKLLRIVDLTRMNIEARVHEAQISQVRPGQIVRVRIDALPNAELAGRVAAVSPEASPADFQTRDVKVYPVSIGLPEVNFPLKPGMTADVQINTATAKGVLRVPIAAVMRMGRKAACAVETDHGFREIPVATGVTDGKFVEIRDGLKEGDRVVMPVKP
jgi:HlyD family secretion protein